MVYHALWGCRRHKLVRKDFPSIAGLGDRGYCSFLDFVLDCLGVLSLQDLEVLCVIWWRFWFGRNQILHASKALDSSEVVGWAHSFLSSYHSACSKPVSSSPQLCLKWEAPSPSWFKINSDAALDVPNKKIGIGVVIRDWEGRVRAALALSLPFILPVDCAEARAILQGFESDTSSVIALIRSHSPPHSEIGLVISDILSLAVPSSSFSFSFRPRCCNAVTHGLAKFGVSCSSPCFWFDETPSCVEDIVSSELVCSF
ncbi:hypothetical protein ACOSQ3_016555 [Xanthoceras sorbifolium]